MNPKALDLPVSDEQFEMLCRDDRHVQLERTKEGAIRVNPPAGGWTSNANAEIIYELRSWWERHKRGRVFDSNAGFRLPDGSILSPDACYISAERLKQLPKGALRGFPKVCPDFVIELLSQSDSRDRLEAKMKDWMVNGAQLGWLIDPYKQDALVYRPKGFLDLIIYPNLALTGEGPVEGFVLNLAHIWECYRD